MPRHRASTAGCCGRDGPGVHRFLRDLLEDLAHRCDAVRERLLQVNVPGPANDLALTAARLVISARRDIGDLLADAALDNPALVPDHLRLFRRLAERVQLAENYALPHLERFTQHDTNLSGLAARMIAEANIPMLPPVVTASSSAYYWTMPFFYLISVPAGEPGSLLGLSDLGHEFGHILIATTSVLPDRVGVAVNDWFQDARHQAALVGAPHANQLRVTGSQWTDNWLDEFACDVVATYLFGSSFGFQHVRLCALLGTDPFEPGLGQQATHPADEARLRLIVSTLTAYGATEDAAAVRDLWDRFIAHQLGTMPPQYGVCYPDALLDLVAREVVAQCQSEGIADSLALRSKGDTVAAILLDAWGRFAAESQSFKTWEEASLTALFAAT